MINFRKNKLRLLLVLPLLIPALPVGELQAATAPKKCIALRNAATPAEADAYSIRVGPASNLELLHIRGFTTPDKEGPPAALKDSEEIITPEPHPPAAWNCKPLKTYKVKVEDEAALKQQPTLRRPHQGTEKSTLLFDAMPALAGIPAEDTAAKQVLALGQTEVPPQVIYQEAVWNAPSVREARQQLPPGVKALFEESRSYGLQGDQARLDAVEGKMEKAAESYSAQQKEKINNFFRALEQELEKHLWGPGQQPKMQSAAHYQELYRSQVVDLLPTLDAAQRKRTADFFRNVLAHYKNLNLQLVITLVPENLTGLSAEQQAQIVNYNKALKQELIRAGATKHNVRFVTDPV